MTKKEFVEGIISKIPIETELISENKVRRVKYTKGFPRFLCDSDEGISILIGGTSLIQKVYKKDLENGDGFLKSIFGKIEEIKNQ